MLNLSFHKQNSITFFKVETLNICYNKQIQNVQYVTVIDMFNINVMNGNKKLVLEVVRHNSVCSVRTFKLQTVNSPVEEKTKSLESNLDILGKYLASLGKETNLIR